MSFRSRPGPLDQIAIRDLKLICAIYEQGTLAKAADFIGISQSNASYSLEKARVTFSDPLFRSVKRKMVPTTLCSSLYELAKLLVDDLRALNDRSARDDVSTGEINILCRTTAFQFCEDFADRLFEALPDVRVSFVINKEQDIDPYLMNDFDFFVGPARLTDFDFETYQVPDLPVTMVFNADLLTPPQTPEDISKHRYAVPWPMRNRHETAAPVLALESRNTGLIDKGLKAMGLPPRVIGLCNPNLQQLGAILHRRPLIYTGMPAALPASFEGLSHTPVPMDLPPMRVAMRWHRKRGEQPLTRLAIDLMQKVLETTMNPDPATWRTTPYRHS